MEHEVFVMMSAERLGEALADPARVARAIPGLQQDVGAEAESVAGRLKVRVAGHTITYRGTLRVSRQDETSYAIEAEALEARGTGGVKLSLSLRLLPARGGTTLAFTGTATGDGRIAELPEDAVASAGTRLLGRFAEGLGAGSDGTPGPAEKRADGDPPIEDLLPTKEPDPTEPTESGRGREGAGGREGGEDTGGREGAEGHHEGVGGGEGDEGGNAEGPGPGTGTGSDSGTGTDSGPGTGTGTGSSTDAGSGPGTGTGPGTDAGTGTGTGPGTGSGSGRGAGPGVGSGDDYLAGGFDGEDDNAPVVPDASSLDGDPQAEAAHARRTMIGRSAEEVDHAPPRGRYAPVPVPETATATATLRWAAPAAALVVASVVVAGRMLRRRR
ncbi:SRPBCC family protein [Streptomyces sp. NPDC048664]|uniref:SRPBCC family protein n=1 Tax=Streptomyces sp. NPDC048664 TaxID=3154505 RepID=UPI003446F93C